jgi:hypothetical protein
LQEFLSEINKFTNNYDPEFPELSYKIELPMPLPAGYNIVGSCGQVIEVADYDYNIQYQSDVVFSLKDPTPDLEVTGLKINDGKKWSVSLKTTSTFRIDEPLTVTVVAKVRILCRLFISTYTRTELHVRNCSYTVPLQFMY